MATTSDVKITAGAGTNVATWDITEDAETKKLQRVGVSDSAGAEALGLVTASPAANTVLGRLKDLLSLIVLGAGTNVIGKVHVTDSGNTELDYTVTTPVGQIGVYPATNVAGVPTAATPVSASSGNVAAASAVATLSGTASKTTYIAGFSATASGATSAAVVSITLTNAIGGTMTWTFTFPAGATTAASPLVVEFCPPIPASATNTAMVLTLPSGGTGNTNASVNAWGFQL